MRDVVISVDRLSKQYRLGQIGTGTLSHDLNRWWHRVRGKEDPYARVGDVNIRSARGGSGYVWSLRDISFSVNKGEVLGIIGKNGAGKSTLLKILSQVTTPTLGNVKIRGRIASLLEVGTGFHPELTGRENIFLNGAILGMSKQEIARKFDEIVAFSGIEKYIDTPVKRFSSGMYVRLGFAIAAHLEPEILIVDEVLAVGDAEFQSKCIGKMKDVSGEGRTVLFVSHNLGMIRALCTRTILLENGTLKCEGETNRVINEYQKSFRTASSVNTLGDRTDRGGNGHLRIDKFWIEDEHSETSSEIEAGRTYTFNMVVKRFVHGQGDNFFAAVIIKESDGVRMFTMTSDFFNKSFYVNDEVKITFRFKNPLSKGNYFVDLMIFGNKEIIDEIESAAEFSSVSNDYFGTGKAQAANIDKFFVDFAVNGSN